MRFLLGAYGPDMGGIAEGVALLDAGAADSPLAGGALSFRGTVARASSPSWIARHPRLDVVYAGLEGSGEVVAFTRVGEGTFRRTSAAIAVGESVCHIAVAPDGSSLIASCYGDGRVVRLALDGEGRPSSPAAGAAAHDPYGPDAADVASRSSAGDIDLAAAARALRDAAGAEYAHLVPFDGEEEPAAEPARGMLLSGADEEGAVARASHAHAAAFLPDGRIATTDLGVDLVRIWRPRPGGLRLDHEVVLPRGSGPRHLTWHPSGHLYVVTEYSAEVFVLRADVEGTWRLHSAASLGAQPGDTAAEVSLALDGAFVHAGLRGSDTVAALRVRGQGDTLEPIALVEAGVTWPRHHAVVRDELLVAGERSHDVVSMTIDQRTGVPGRVRHRVEAPSPTRILPLP